ncbi:DUF5107 domain-containing protein [Dyella mobilis]|uniref:DUF5107 domain-containing protein n=1 Tax=Dyella mobilis TaxID=1849582 RepID=A0ABS2KDB8_9GAMM|nr:DUF5107 domain-containing protein [Dyella mobilis]MBM7129035.1 DUF5107 domain-containing protein [Dyella mobilis]GLQ99271.1 hypothetical protein GCM10007863_36910 [Dyella mobilis]
MRLAATILILLLLPSPWLHAQTRVWQGELPLATSDEGPPNENPPFDIFATDRFVYPYSMREDVRSSETVHNWRAVFLENEYIKCTVLPDLGGHIYTCIDKLNGQPMFYANPTLKKALIGYRGAWSAFGVEFNFPVSHNWVSLSPVDYAFSSAADGSASVTVGNRDRVYGMEWTVQLILRPGSTVLEERVTLTNRSDLRHRFYWWNNAGVQVWDDSKIWYPTPFTAAHGFADVDTWPVNAKGVDLSLVANHKDGPVSRFVYGSREPFMGIYHPHTDAGVVHYANYSDLPAKKIWSWGEDAAGLAWRKALSDNDSAYAEVQAGLFRNQETYGFLEPQQVIRFSEYWMPVRHIGGISSGNLNGVVYLSRKADANGKIALTAAFNTNRKVQHARIAILDGGKAVFEEVASLDPAKTWSHTLNDLPSDRSYTFLLEDDNKAVLLKHTEGVYDWTPRDEVKTGPQVAHKPDLDTAAGLLEQGTNEELQGNLLAARKTYQRGLAAYPVSLEFLKAEGRLDVNLFRFEEASNFLKQVEDRATWDGETRYYRGIAERALGHPREARTEFEAAYRDPSYRVAGGLMLAELLAQQHDVHGALEVLAKACPEASIASSSQRCSEDIVALKRSAGQTDEARSLAGTLLETYPTDAFLQHELVRLGSPNPGLDRYLGSDVDRILALVVQYDRLGLYADSLALLSRHYPAASADETEPDAVPPSQNPLLAYYRGYCREQLGESGRADYQAASKMSLRYSFPSRAETIPVLRAALASNAADASAHFLLGSLWFSKGIIEPAEDEWRRAAALRADIPTLDASLGRALLQINQQPAEAAAVFRHGFQVDASNPALYIGMDKAMQQMGKPATQRVAMLERFPKHVDMPAELVRALVDALRENGQSDQADALLAEHFLPRKEGAPPLEPKANAKPKKAD